MKYIAAYLLAIAGGDNEPSEEKVKNILTSVGVEVDQEKLTALLTKIKSQPLEKLIADGKSKMQVVTGGSSAPSPATGGAQKEEVKPQKKEEEAAAAAPLDLGDMFGDW